jgi:hypothetical protein
LPDFHLRQGRRRPVREPKQDTYCKSYGGRKDQGAEGDSTKPGLHNSAVLIGTVYRPDKPVTRRGVSR